MAFSSASVVRLLQDRSHVPRKEPPVFGRYLLIAAGWVALLAAGFGGLLRYESVPGATAAGAPARNADFSNGKSYSLVMALHPHCPCSRASIGELEKIYSHAHDRIQITALVFKPKDEPDSWVDGRTVRELGRMDPRIVMDSDGALAKSLGLSTSGQVLLYSPDGQLLFNGGITSARAHSGDNLGEDAILEIALKGKSDVNTTAVFGCPILERRETQ